MHYNYFFRRSFFVTKFNWMKTKDIEQNGQFFSNIAKYNLTNIFSLIQFLLWNGTCEFYYAAWLQIVENSQTVIPDDHIYSNPDYTKIRRPSCSAKYLLLNMVKIHFKFLLSNFISIHLLKIFEIPRPTLLKFQGFHY